MTKVPKTKKHKKPLSSPSSLNLSFTNIRGLRSNFSSVESYLLQSSPDLLALCETNLSSAVPSCDLSVDGYLPLIRKDSNNHMLGLGIYIHKNSPICRETRFESTDYSFMCFCLAQLHSIAFLFVLYRSPSSQDCTILDVISDQIDQALSLYPSANIVVVGDFNAHHTDWLGSSVSDSAGVKALNFCLSQSLTQIVNFPTRFPDNPNHLPSPLDLCLVLDPSQCSISPHSPLGTSDHGLISLKLLSNSSTSSESPYHRTTYNYLKADWDSFRDFLRDGPWVEIFRLPADKCASYITSWIQAGMESFIPSRRFQVKPHSSPWFSSHCAVAISNRNRYFHIYQQNNSPENRHLFTIARNHCKKVLSDAKARYSQVIKSRISSQKLGSRDFWRIFNSINNKGKSVIPSLLYGSDFVTSPKDKAELFAKNFSSISSLDSTSCVLPDIAVKQVDPLLDIRITSASVSKVISCLDSSTACGPDNIPVVVLQRCSLELSSILSKLFNKCLSESCFPLCWKAASVIPIFKNSGERSDSSNYRPISLLPVISKVFESLINKHLISHLESNNLLSDHQYGFRSSRSTADVLTVITDRFYRALDRGGEVKAIALDISKAFDKVWHAGLFHKLSSYGVAGNVFKIIESFLSNRSIKVVLDGQHSSSHPVTSGVPQGSILGPILFLIYINDLPDILTSKVALFADDTTIYSCHDKKPTLSDCLEGVSELEKDLTSATAWGSQWLVNFNSDKTQF
ncbi:probable RNA-directed DNA polymerase from transposon BS [Hydra vulgaris]|uniref:probable RNA-directed DNA polymerase from transposon BS n=1 Tax=Hydra vulgaris TaxID=6087 RepID=UPI0032EA710C